MIFHIFIPYIHALAAIHHMFRSIAMSLLITHSVTFLDIHFAVRGNDETQQRTAYSFTPLNYDVVWFGLAIMIVYARLFLYIYSY